MLGPYEHSLTVRKRSRFVSALAGLVEEFYVWRLSPFYSARALQFGDQVRYIGERMDRSTAVVDMIMRRHGHDVPVEARLLWTRNSWRICDLVVEGVALTENYAAQVGQLLRTQTPGALVATIEHKQAALASQEPPLAPSAVR